jgi:hypothetical protein
MQLHYMILADAAETTREGKFSLVGGGIEVLDLQIFPTFWPMLTAIISLTVEPSECGVQHIGRIQVMGPQDEFLNTLMFDFTPHENPPETTALPIRFRFLANLSGMRIDEPGLHHSSLLVDEREISSIPFLVLHAQHDTSRSHGIEQE